MVLATLTPFRLTSRESRIGAGRHPQMLPEVANRSTVGWIWDTASERLKFLPRRGNLWVTFGGNAGIGARSTAFAACGTAPATAAAAGLDRLAAPPLSRIFSPKILLLTCCYQEARRRTCELIHNRIPGGVYLPGQ
jgi:hypothetical protein